MNPIEDRPQTFCLTCGNPVYMGAVICPYCHSSQSNPASSRDAWEWLVIFGIIAVCMAEVCFCGAPFYSLGGVLVIGVILVLAGKL